MYINLNIVLQWLRKQLCPRGNYIVLFISIFIIKSLYPTIIDMILEYVIKWETHQHVWIDKQ